jgi:predicted ABC-type ATPase
MSDRPRVVVIAGPNGAGKSTTAPEIVRKGFGINEFVNADTIARGLSEFAPEKVAFTAGRIFLDRIHDLSAEGASFAFETTLATRSFLPMLKRMQARSYEVHVIFLWLPTAVMAVERVGARVRRGGHFVPDEVVQRRYFRGLANFFNAYRSIADSWIMLDNSSEHAPKAIAWRNINGPLHMARSGPWQDLRKEYERDAFDQT